MQYRGRSPRTIFYGRTDVALHPTPGGRGSPPLRCEWVGIDVHPAVSVIRRRGVGDAAPYGRFVYFALRHITKGHSPRTIWGGRTKVVLHPRPGGRGSPPLRRVREVSASLPRRPQPLSHGPLGRDSSPFRGADGVGAARRRRSYAKPAHGRGLFSVHASSGGFLPLCRARAVVSGRFSLRSSKKAMTEKVTAPRKQTKRSSIVS